MERFNNVEEFNVINPTSTDIEQNSRYEVNDINCQINIADLKINTKSNNKLKKINCIPYLIFIDIFVIVITIAFAIAYAIINSKYKENYRTYDDDIYKKPITLEHNYSRIKFDNGITFVLTKVHFNDTAGGAIAFDKGYLDNEYEPGHLNLAFTNLIYNLKFNNTNKTSDSSQHLYNYLGKIKYSVDEDYSCFFFSILNNGFLEYLKYFSELLYLKDNDKRLENNNIIKSLNHLPNPEENKDKRENHLLEFLIYGCKNKSGEEILPQGSSTELNKNLENTFEKIREIMKGLLNSPSKIKIILYSHHKFSIIRKVILKYFKIVFDSPNENQNKIEENNQTDFETNKIIYYEIGDDETNYLKINYYINNINITDKKHFYIDSKYFNLIKDIFQETKNGSLYYELTEGTFNKIIKSISCNIDIILKSKIIFSIKIELNRRSYKYIIEIINTVYEYIKKVQNYVGDLNEEEERIKKLSYIYKQSFIFVADEDDEEDFAQKAKKLFYLDDSCYFLRDDWFPLNYSSKIHIIKEYFKQLTKNNSVIILGINNYTKNMYLNNANISFIFNNCSNTKYFNLHYTCNDLSKLNITENSTNDNKTIEFTQNEYISNYDENNIINILNNSEKDENKLYLNKTEEICSINSNTYRFFYFGDTSFKMPKVYISLYILHPFLRPNLTKSNNDNLFFQLISYISYLKDEINYRLADAIRAGTEFKVDFSENFIYIDIFCFSDIFDKILKKIVEILKTKIKNNYEIYNDYALEALNLKRNNKDDKITLDFYKYISDDLPIYNFYDFPIKDFKNETVPFNETVYSFIIQGYIYGVIQKEDPSKICSIFGNLTGGNFLNALEMANLNNGNVTLENFVKKLMNRIEITRNVPENNNTVEKNDKKNYLFKKMSPYNFRNSIFAYIIEDFFNYFNSEINVQLKTQKYIHLKIICEKTANCNKDNITKKIIYELDRGNLNNTVDLVGDRFYYLLRNTQNYYQNKFENIRKAAIKKSTENLYDTYNESEKISYFDTSFDDFKEEFTKLNDASPYCIAFE